MVSADLRCDVSRDDGVVTIALAGDIDVSSVAAMREALEQAVRAGSALVVVDFSQLSFLDSTGINCLVQARADGEAVGCRLLVRNATGIARRVLEITGLAELMCEELAGPGAGHPGAGVGS